MKTDAAFDGADYNHDRDHARLAGQIAEIFALMKDGAWRTLSDISALTGHPEASVSAQLRNLRKDRYGGYTIDTQHIEHGLYVYRLDLSASRQRVQDVRQKARAAQVGAPDPRSPQECLRLEQINRLTLEKGILADALLRAEGQFKDNALLAFGTDDGQAHAVINNGMADMCRRALRVTGCLK